jgi:hypothetical protein
MPKRALTAKKVQKRKEIKAKSVLSEKERILTLTELPETNEYRIEKKETEHSPAAEITFPQETRDFYQMMPDDFAQAQNAIDALLAERREVEVFANSIESGLGYGSLLRVLSRVYNNHVAYLRSERGGSLSLEEARAQAYRRDVTDEEALKMFDILVRCPSEKINFWDLMTLNHNSPAMAQNLWEMIKREAAKEFETGHRAAEAFEPVDYMTDAWNRASYLGFRESLCEEWQPKGGVELSMIDAVAQAWLQLQFWTKESVKRASTRPREENRQFAEWKKWRNKAEKQWDDGYWDIPYVYEQEAINQAAQMADRWQRMYFRAIRNLRDWRRYTPQVTINNPAQVNIANDGGQQINVSNSEALPKEKSR